MLQGHLEFEDCCRKLDYPERIDLTALELKIILSERRELELTDKKFRHRDWLKAGSSPSLTDVAERLGALPDYCT